MRYDIHNERCIDFSIRRQATLPWPDGQTRYFASGREALTALIKAPNPPPESSVLLPAYVPEGVIAPFLRCGWKVGFYPLTRYLDPDWEQLEKMLRDSSPKLAVMIHYFGLQKPINRFCELCRRYGTLVIEDMAHVIQDADGSMGSTGDFVLYSLPKMLGVPDGAPLVIRAEQFNIDELTFKSSRLHTLYLLQQMVVLTANTLSRKIPTARYCRLGRHLAGRLADPYSTLMRYFEKPHRMSRISRFIVNRTDFPAIVRRRRRYTQLYRKGLNPDIFERFPESGEGQHGMFGFPTLVNDRDTLIRSLALNGIEGIYLEDRWDFIPEEDRPRHQAAIDTMKRHFLFPTSPHLRQNEIEYIIDCANEWARSRVGVAV